MTHVYRVTYDVKSHPGISKEELQKASLGGCDSLVLISIVRDDPSPDPFAGAKSFAVVSLDGHAGKPCRSAELFQAWAAMAEELKAHNLPVWQYKICHAVIVTIRQFTSKDGH